MSFGFSAGDISTTLSLTGLVARQLQFDQSIKDHSPKEILGHLEVILNRFWELQVSNTSSRPQYHALVEVASQFRVSLERFISSSRSRSLDKAGVRETCAPDSTSNWSHKSIKTFNAEINGHLISLHLLKRFNDDWMTKEILQSSPIVKDHFHLRDVRKLNAPVVEVICAFDRQNTLADRTMQIISTNLRIYTAVVNLHQRSTRIPAQVQLSSPVTLNDACGRRAPFHLEFINSYEAFHEVLMLRFNNETSLQSAVKDEEFVLSSVKPYRITDLGALKKTWRTGFKPGEAVDMSITISSGTKCLLCGSKIPFTEAQNKTCDYCSTSYRLRPQRLGETAIPGITLSTVNETDQTSELRLSRNLQDFIIKFLSDEFTKFPEFGIWGPSAVDKWEPAQFFNKFSELVRRFGSELLDQAGAEFEREVANTLSRRHLAITKSFRMLANGSCSHNGNSSSNTKALRKKCLKTSCRASAGPTPQIGREGQISVEQDSDSCIEKKAVMSFLTSGNALANLGQQIRRTLYFDFDPYSKFTSVDAEVMDGLRTMNSFKQVDHEKKYSATFKPFWQLWQFSQVELEGGTDLGPVITLSGSAVYARAIQCGTYIKENWGQTGLDILLAIQSAFGNESLRSEGLSPRSEAPQLNAADLANCTSSMEINVEIHPRKGPDSKEFAMIGIVSSLETLKKAGHCLTWLTAAIRVSQYNDMSYSDATFTNCTYLAPFSTDPVFQNSMYFEIYAGDLLPLHDEEKKMCWNPLFPHSVIADGFPIPKRPEMPGLEISFDIMTFLSGVSYPINHSGGLVLQGLTTMLVPTKIDSGNSVQWHFMHKPKGSRVTLKDVEENCKQRHKSQDLRSLQENRAFLGWSKEANVYLGTKGMNYSGIKGSQALRPEPRIQLAGFSVGIGSGGMGYGGPTAALNFTVGKRQRNEYSQGQDQELESKLVKTKVMPLILYDPQEKRAWLVSALSVILHLAHIYAHIWPELVKVNNRRVEMPYAKPSSDGGQAALDVILEHHKMPIYQPTLTKEPRYFINLIQELYSSLMEVIDKNKLHDIPSEGLFGGRSTLFGWELMSIVSSPLGLLDKEHKLESTNGGWVHFAVGVPVLFCDGLGDLIRPSPDQNHLCKSWLTAPTGKDYLTASMSMLKILGDGCGYRDSCYKLSESITWIQADNLFPDCRHDVDRTHKRCYRPLQTLKKLGSRERKKKAIDLLADRPPGAAVIFGKRSSRIPRLRVSLSRGSDDEYYSGTALGAASHLRLPVARHQRNDSGYSTGEVDPDSENSEDDEEQESTLPGTPSTVANMDAPDIFLDPQVEEPQRHAHVAENKDPRWPGGFLRLYLGVKSVVETVFVPAMICCLVLLFAKAWILKEECFSAL